MQCTPDSVLRPCKTYIPNVILFEHHILAVTGHRPDKLGGYSPEAAMRLREFAKIQLTKLNDGKLIIYTGMAIGWDQAIAHACVVLNIPFVACIPFYGQETRWTEENQKEYHELLKWASRTIYVDNGEGDYAVWKMHHRNKYMVNACNTLLALWNGDLSGGTYSAVTYARKVNVNIINCWEDWCNYGYLS